MQVWLIPQRSSQLSFKILEQLADHFVDLFVCQALHQAGQGFVLAKEVFAVVAAIVGGEGLHLAVHRIGQRLHKYRNWASKH